MNGGIRAVDTYVRTISGRGTWTGRACQVLETAVAMNKEDIAVRALDDV